MRPRCLEVCTHAPPRLPAVDRGTERAEHVDERTSPRYDRGTLAAATDTATDTVTDTATDRRACGERQPQRGVADTPGHRSAAGSNGPFGPRHLATSTFYEGSSRSDLGSSSMLTSLNVTTRTVLTNRAGR